MGAPLRHILRMLSRDESGQSLIVVVSSMTVLLSMAGFGIDAGTWMVRHHNDQVVADSAALAAAQCLANPNQASTMFVSGSEQTVPECTSSTDTTDAQQVAVDYAAANGVTISTADVSVNTTTDVVTVTARTTAPGIFARVFGMSTSTQSASAGAGWTAGSGQCTSPGAATCDFMFAHDSNCLVSTNGILLNQSGNLTINGEIQSNANLSGGTSGNPSLGAATFGPDTGTNGTCANKITWSGNNPWQAGVPTQASVDYPYPIDYTKDFPACGGSGEAACQASGALAGYPSFCTNGGSNITLTGSTNNDAPDAVQSGNIYCASGTGQTNKPSTWTGSITITLSGKDTLYDTFVGGSIDFDGSGKDVLSSCGYTVTGYTASNCDSSVPAPTTTNYPIFYATGTSSYAADINVSGSQTLNGDVFAPIGGALLNMSGGKTLTSFIEANNINANISGNFLGDGPPAGSIGGGGGGAVTLVQ